MHDVGLKQMRDCSCASCLPLLWLHLSKGAAEFTLLHLLSLLLLVVVVVLAATVIIDHSQALRLDV